MLLPRKVKTSRLDLWSEKQYLQWSAYNSCLTCHCRPCENNVKKKCLCNSKSQKTLLSIGMELLQYPFFCRRFGNRSPMKSLKLQHVNVAHVVSRTCKKVMQRWCLATSSPPCWGRFLKDILWMHHPPGEVHPPPKFQAIWSAALCQDWDAPQRLRKWVSWGPAILVSS